MSRNDENIQATNDDATLCKSQGVKLRYWEDKFLQYFVKYTAPKAPEINRGYFVRTQAFKAYVDYMITVYKDDLQIINFGAGFDTLYFRLCLETSSPIKVVDIDLPLNSSRKVQAIMQKKPLTEVVRENAKSEVTHTRWDLHAEPYHIVGADLRNLPEIQVKLESCSIDYKKPTLFLSECVLVYIDGDSSTSLLQFISKNFSTACFLLYEQINMEDRFGETMLRNLSERGCSLPGIGFCKSIDSQQDRFISAGWNKAKAWNINEVYKSFPKDTINRIERIEHLDECEVMQQLFDHYCFAAATSGDFESGDLFDLRKIIDTIR